MHDKHALPQLLHGGEQEVYGDSAYALQQDLIASKAPKARDRTNQRVIGSGVVAELERIVNRIKSKVRSRVEHVFAVVKRQFGFAKVRYRGLAKNATRAFVVLGLANIYLARGRLGGRVRPQRATGPPRGPKGPRSRPLQANLSAGISHYAIR